MAARAEAVAIIIDVSPSMNEAADGEETPLQKCITAANMIVQRKIFTDTKKNKDEVVLILFGTEGTENDLNTENGEGYEHITVVKELCVMDLEILKFINQQITSGPEDGDFIDAMVVAIDHLHKKCMGRKMDQKIVLFSNLCCEFNGDDLDNIVNGMKANNVNFIFVGPEMEDNDDNDDDNGDKTGPSTRNGDNNQKPLSTQQTVGVNCIGHLLKEVDGDGLSINEILPMLSYFETRRKKQVTTFRGPIEIGTSLKINVYSYVKVKEERPAAWKKLSALAEHAANRDTMGVEMQRSFHLNDEDQTEVEKENTAQAYRYGKTLVPMTADDQKSMKLQTTKGCIVLGFTSRDNVSRHLYTRDTCHIFAPQPDDEHAAVAFSAFCHALEEKNMVAIVRYVSRGNTDPKIGFLSPHIKSSYESLVFISLPYREDIRTYMFASLEGGINKPVTDEQLNVVDSLIDSMFLVRKSLDDDDEEVEEELCKPKNTLNPVTQRQCQCIQSRALNPDEMKIPDIEEYIKRSIRAQPVTVNGCEATYGRMKECFPLTQVETKKKSASSMFNKGNEEPHAKKPKESGVDLTFGNLTRDQVTEVGIVNPLEDFKTLMEMATGRNTENEALSQMSNVVMKLLKESFLDQYYPKAMECMKALREQCIKLKRAKAFNDLLLQLKEETYGKRRQDFWERLTDGTFNPINKDYAGDSKYSDVESRSFFAVPDEKKDVAIEQSNIEDDSDDLLDML